MRDWVVSEGAKGDNNSLDTTINSAIYAIIGRIKSLSQLRDLDDNLHDFWHMFIDAAKNLHCDNPRQDKLVYQVLYLKEIGTLARNIPKDGGQGLIAETSNGQKL